MEGAALLRPISSTSRFAGRLLFRSSTRPRRFTSSSAASSRPRARRPIIPNPSSKRYASLLRRHLRPISTFASPFHLPRSLSSSYSPPRAVSTSSSPAASDVESQFVVAEKLGFEVVSEQFLEECKSRAVLYRHKKTGAEVMSVFNDDENKVFGIVFRTPPKDSTGIPHILEHSVLCGSRKYPLKEPFVELLKGSLHTFLNAFTYPDRTCYPVASTNTKDFYNLVDVYLDAVFFPKCVEDCQTFQQEGWHYELNDPSEDISFKGVVFNEMKGVYSQPDSVLGRATQQALFPDNTYGVDSGGDPKVIPKLTFEEFRDFHQKYYHPSNARIWFYGDDDPNERLRILSEYLDMFDASSSPDESKVVPQKLFSEPLRVVEKYPAGDGEDLKKKHMVCLNWLLSDKPLDLETELMLGFMDHLLLGTPASPLRKILLESGLGEAIIGGGIEDELLQPQFSIGLKGVSEENLGKVEELVMSSLKNLAETGFDSDAVEASMNTIEFSLRENNTGSFPRGLSLMLRSIGKWIYDLDPFQPLKYEKPLMKLKAKIAEEGSKAVFSPLIEQYILNNPHLVTIEMQPDPEKASRDEAEEKQILDKVKASMTEEDLAELARATQELRLKQETPDPPEALRSVPSLSLSDIPKKPIHVPIEVGEINGVKVLRHDLFTNDIVYTEAVFDMSSVKQELLPLMPLFCQSLLEMGTKDMEFVQLNQLIGRKTGGISVYPFTSSVRGKKDPCSHVIVRGKAMGARAEDLFNLMNSVLQEVQFTDQKRFRQFVSQSKARMENRIRGGGHGIAAARMDAKLNIPGWVSEQMGGISYLEYLRGLEERVDKDWDGISSSLEEIRKSLFSRNQCLVNLTADGKNISNSEKYISKFLEMLPSHNSAVRNSWNGQLSPENEAIVIPTQVNYVGKAANLYETGYELKGSAYVISRYISNTWLWDRVRVSGGAYGGFCDFDTHSGVFTYLSYRDPNLLKTLDIYDATADFLRELDMDDDTLAKAIIGTIGDVDSYQLPDAKGYSSLLRHLLGITEEERERRREEILSTRIYQFKITILSRMDAALRLVEPLDDAPGLDDLVEDSSDSDFVPVDYSSHFTTDKEWSDRDSMITWAKNIGLQLHMVIVISKSWPNRKVILSCEKSGPYRAAKKKGDDSTEETPKRKYNARTKKSECPFKLNGVFIKGDWMKSDCWRLYVACGSHDHELSSSLIGHAFAGRISKDKRERVKSLSASGIKPKAIMSLFLHEDPKCLTSRRQLYDYKNRERLKCRGNMTVPQYMLEFLEGRGYYTSYQTRNNEEGSEVLSDIFISHPGAMHLLSLFSSIVIMDTTYKTNRYGMPLLEFVGFTCTNRTFCIAIVFMYDETTEHYTWALDRLKIILEGREPAAIMSDRELGLTKAMDIVFPNTKHLLCRVHVNRNVEAFAMKWIPNIDHFSGNIRWLLRSPTEDVYNQRLEYLTEKWKKLPWLMEYVKSVWLRDYKEMLVCAWCDTVLHFGTRSSNRVESQHSMLKDGIESSVGGLETLVQQIDNMFVDQIREVRGDMEQSAFKAPTEIVTGPPAVKTFFRRILYKVSEKCLRMLYAQVVRAMQGKIPDEECRDVFWRATLGLPCPHTIKEYVKTGFPLRPSEIHSYWKQIKWEGVGHVNLAPNDGVLVSEEDIVLGAMFGEWSNEELHPELKTDFTRRYKLFHDSRSCTAEEPPAASTKKGRPKKKKNDTKRDPSWFEHMAEEKRKKEEEKKKKAEDRKNSSVGSKGRPPSGKPRSGISPGKESTSGPPKANTGINYLGIDWGRDNIDSFMLAYIGGVQTVMADGHCGYRSLAVLQADVEDQYIYFRFELSKELQQRRALYTPACSVTPISDLIRSVNFIGACTRDHWMEVPIVGLAFATRFQVALVVLSYVGPHTCLPMWAPPGAQPPTKVHAIALVGNHDHFVPVWLVDDLCPIPPPPRVWTRWRDASVEGWEQPFQARMQDYIVQRRMSGNGDIFL